MKDEDKLIMDAAISACVIFIPNLWLLCWYNQYMNGQWWGFPLVITHLFVAVAEWLVLAYLLYK